MWDAFLEVFHKKYFSHSVREQREKEFVHLTQGSMMVAQYEAKFTQLVRFVPHIAYDKDHRARRFEMGLRAAIRTRLTTLRLRDYSELVDRAMLVEKYCDDFTRVKNQRKRP